MTNNDLQNTTQSAPESSNYVEKFYLCKICRLFGLPAPNDS